jgi:hypothetical protein
MSAANFRYRSGPQIPRLETSKHVEHSDTIMSKSATKAFNPDNLSDILVVLTIKILCRIWL